MKQSPVLSGGQAGAHGIEGIGVARQLGPEARVATLMVDSGLKYLSTDVYRVG